MSSKAMADRVAVEAFPTDVTNNGVSLPPPSGLCLSRWRERQRRRPRRRRGEGGN